MSPSTPPCSPYCHCTKGYLPVLVPWVQISFSNVRAERIRSGCTKEFGESMANAFAQELGHNSSIVLNTTGLYIDDTLDLDSPITERLGHAQGEFATLQLLS